MHKISPPTFQPQVAHRQPCIIFRASFRHIGCRVGGSLSRNATLNSSIQKHSYFVPHFMDKCFFVKMGSVSQIVVTQTNFDFTKWQGPGTNPPLASAFVFFDHFQNYFFLKFCVDMRYPSSCQSYFLRLAKPLHNGFIFFPFSLSAYFFV